MKTNIPRECNIMSKDLFKENTNDEDIAEKDNKCSLNEYNTKKFEILLDDIYLFFNIEIANEY